MDTSQAEELQISGEIGGTRGDHPSFEMPRTGLFMEPDDTSWISSSVDIESANSEYLQIDEKVPSGRSSFRSSPYSAFRSQNSRYIQEYKGILFMSYTTYESSPSDTYHCWLSASFDQGRTWSSREVLSRSNLDSTAVDLLIYQDKIFYLAKFYSWSSDLRLSHIKVTHYLNWMNISSVPYKEIIPDERMESSSLIGHGDQVLLFWKPYAMQPSKAYYMIYRNNTWSGQIDKDFSVQSLCPISSTLNGKPILYLFYSPSVSNSVFVKNSTDGGINWGLATKAGKGGGSLAYLVGVSCGEVVHLAGSLEYGNLINYIRYEPGTPSNNFDIATYGLNGQDWNDKELSISADGRRVAVAYENSMGTISTIVSSDGGSTFQGRWKFGSGSAHCPSMDRDHKYLIFINGSNVEIHAWAESDAGMIRSTVISPPGVVSWDQFAFSIGGVSDPDSFRFKVISPGGSTQYYPGTGYRNLDGLASGNISSLYFGYIGEFDGPFSTGSNQVNDIVIEMRFLKSYGNNPLLFGMFINFTVDYPYKEDFSGQYHVQNLDKCQISGVGIELEDGEYKGEAVLGPYYIEDMPPDHLSLRCSFVNGENYVKASILGGDLQPIYGFDYSNTGNLIVPGEERYIFWDQRSLGSLPESISIFYIGLQLTMSDTISPKVNWLNLIDSQPPQIMDVSVDSPEIYRGGSLEISIDLSDNEEPEHMLDISMEIRNPINEQWTNKLVSEPIFDNGSWKFDFYTDYDTAPGEYRLRALAQDSVGRSSGLIYLDQTIFVMNNPPTPPLVSLSVEPFTGNYFDLTTVKLSSDLETPDEYLTYNVSLLVDGEVSSTYSNLTDLDMEYRDRAMIKEEEWMLSIHSWDGLDPSERFEAIWIVNNSPPLIDDIPDIVLDEDQEPWEIPLDRWIEDMDGDQMFYDFSTGPGIDLHEDEGRYYILTEADYNGESYIQINASDGEYFSEANITLLIHPINDPPVWNHPSPITVYEGSWAFINVDARDDLDMEMVYVGHNIADVIPVLIEGDNYYQFPNGSIKLRTDNGMVGSHIISMVITDSAHNLTDEYSLTIMNVNQPPDRPLITIDQMKNVFVFGEDITLSVSGSDPDEIWGDNLTFSWRSDLMGDLGEGMTIMPDLDVGVHMLVVTVTDDEGSTNSTDITITVIEQESKESSVIRTWALYSAVILIGLVLGIIIAFVIVVVGMRRNDDDADDIQHDRTGKSSEHDRNGTGSELLPPHIKENTSRSDKGGAIPGVDDRSNRTGGE